jgi:hypothetical protein
MKRVLVAALLSFVFLGVGRCSFAATLTYTNNLFGSSESPPNASIASGAVRVEFDTVAHTLHLQVKFENLSANSTAAHIHAATAVPGVGTTGVATVPPAFPGFPLGVMSGTLDNTYNTLDTAFYNAPFLAANGGTAAGAEAALVASMNAGTAYFNIHTTAVPSGEIRGFLLLTPEPSSVILLGAGLLGVLACSSYRKARDSKRPRA